MDRALVINELWPVVCKCWKKSANLIEWAQHKRGQPNYLEHFKPLYDMSEEYRKSKGYEDPLVF